MYYITHKFFTSPPRAGLDCLYRRGLPMHRILLAAGFGRRGIGVLLGTCAKLSNISLTTKCLPFSYIMGALLHCDTVFYYLDIVGS